MDTDVTPFFGGRLRIVQPAKGFRFGTDALLLAWFVLTSEKSGPFFELGTGSGVISAILGRCGFGPGTAVDVQAGMVDCAKQTMELNDLTNKVQVAEADIRHLAARWKAGSSELVLFNPPYFREKSGWRSADEANAIARQEGACTLDEVLSSFRYLLPAGGRGYLVYPSFRVGDVFAALPAYRLRPGSIRVVYPVAGRDAGHMLVQVHKGGNRDPVIGPPLVAREAGGSWGEWFGEIERMLG